MQTFPRLVTRLLSTWLILSSLSAFAADDRDYLLLLTSQRNAETIAAAANQLQQQYPDLQIKARTDVQLREQPQQTHELINNSLGVIGAGLFGPSVVQLRPLLQQHRGSHLLFNSDHRLVATSQWRGQPLFANDEQVKSLSKADANEDFYTWLQQEPWLIGRSYWQAGGSDNAAALMTWFFAQHGKNVEPQKAKPLPRLRWLHSGNMSTELPALKSGELTVIIDHAGSGRPADRHLNQTLCEHIQQHNNSQCVAAMAYWGEAGVETIRTLKSTIEQRGDIHLNGIVMLQDFVIGGGEGREQVTQMLSSLNVPVIKAIKLRDRNAMDYQLSSDGLPHEKVYYQVAMPELQGAGQPLVIATAGAPSIDPASGIRIQPIAPAPAGLDALQSRLLRWQALQNKANSDKRVAIIYYNHPPGRHNIGADNLDVPASLWQILQTLKSSGYNTGQLPESQQALLDLLQRQGVNMPNNADTLAAMSPLIQKVQPAHYQQWFKKLPATVQQEMQNGPFGLLHQQILATIENDRPELGLEALDHTLEEMHHLLEGVDHPGRPRALALVEQLEHCYLAALKQGQKACLDDAQPIIEALQKVGIEGLGGWGPAPGKVMTYQGKILLPGIQFGNVFIGPQPPRGWEINEELLHANLAFPPPHQYLAFYQFLREDFKADAFVHLGRHSTYEFLPRRSVGLAEDDYPRIVAADIPGIYPYIVDGVGEGIQAKRRGLAVMVDHLTPPLQSTPLYDQLLQLRQLVESFEALHGSEDQAVTQRLVQQMRERIDELELKDELAEAMSSELAVMGIGFDEVDDDMLVHEIGHYLTDLQERFMPMGLHAYGKDWKAEATQMMLDSIAPENNEQRADWLDKLVQSPKAEMTALLDGLAGGYIEPGQGNDPIRSPDSLPTGRNFYALDSSLIPSRAAWELGSAMAADARANNPQSADKREALILWASDVVRDEGVMIAFGLDMLGLQPVWNSRGLVKGLKHLPEQEQRVRRDMVFTTSGLFRDLYGQQMMLLNRATLMALDASSDSIRRNYPALTMALQAALEPLGKAAQGGAQSLQSNQVAAHWVTQARELLASNTDPAEAGVVASLRVFGDAPGSYGAGINRLAERSGAWEKRSELADVYLRRLGHSYGSAGFGRPAQDAFKTVLAEVENTYFGRSSNLYGLIDNNDAFDYLGGLSLSVETLTGAAPNNYVINHSDPNRVVTQPLGTALRQELRGRFLNPEWLKPLMEHGYAGARTMGSEFLEYLWGWQITNPTLVGDWAWEEVKAVYIDDRHNLNLDEFLSDNHNAHVKTNMLAVMLVAIHKEFWNADHQTTEQLASEFADLVARNGLPGSGHTDPGNPMLPWLQQHLSAEQWQQLQQQITAAEQPQDREPEQHRITELTTQLDAEGNTSATDTAADSDKNNGEATEEEQQQWLWLLLALTLIGMAGFLRSLHSSKEI